MSYDSDDDYVICQDCGEMCDVSEINRVILCTLKKVMLCLSCKTWLENIDALEKISDDEEEEEEKSNKLEAEADKRVQQKEKLDNLTIWDKIVELEVQICYKLHGPNWNSCASGGGLGQRLSLYENVRFKELQKTCPVIEQASRAIYNFAQPIHLQIEKPYEKKDQPEKILVILEKWLEDVDPVKYREIKGLPSVPLRVPPSAFLEKFYLLKKNTI